jgi:hypothetical protein
VWVSLGWFRITTAVTGAETALAHLYNRDFEDPAEKQASTKRRLGTAAAVSGLVIFGVISAFGWRAYAGSSYPSWSLGNSAANTRAPETVGIDEFHAYQQQVKVQLQSNAQALAAEQAEVKRLSDQGVALSGKIDALSSAISSARAAMPAAPPPQPKSKTKPSARISTGGAPLPPPIQITH